MQKKEINKKKYPTVCCQFCGLDYAVPLNREFGIAFVCDDCLSQPEENK